MEETSRVLFDIYYPTSEPFYAVRQLDQQVEDALSLSGVWLYGPSGYGKTSAIRHSVYRSHAKIVHLCLASAVGRNAMELLAAVYVELCDALGEEIHSEPSQWSKAVERSMAEVLMRHSTSVPVHIYIDEIPAESSLVYAEFTRRLVAFFVGYSARHPPPHPKYLVSSVFSPLEYLLADEQRKISERLRFVSVGPWSDDELRRLVELTSDALGLRMEERDRHLFILKAKRSPRVLKNFLRRYIETMDRPEWTAERVVAEELAIDVVGG